MRCTIRRWTSAPGSGSRVIPPIFTLLGTAGILVPLVDFQASSDSEQQISFRLGTGV